MIFVLMTDCRSPSSDTHTAQQQFQCIPSQLLLSQRQQPFRRPRRHHLSIAEFLHSTSPCSCPACTEDSTHTRLPSSFLSSSKASGRPRTSARDQDTVSSRRTTSHTSCGAVPWHWLTTADLILEQVSEAKFSIQRIARNIQRIAIRLTRSESSMESSSRPTLPIRVGQDSWLVDFTDYVLVHPTFGWVRPFLLSVFCRCHFRTILLGHTFLIAIAVT